MLQAEIIGNLGKDVQFQNQNGFQFYSFSVAHSVKRKDQSGKEAIYTTWVDCMMTKEQGERVAPFLRKGQKVYCRGSLNARVYQTKQGTYACGLSVRVSYLELCGSTADHRAEQQQQTQGDFNVQPQIPTNNAQTPQQAAQQQAPQAQQAAQETTQPQTLQPFPPTQMQPNDGYWNDPFSAPLIPVY